jgi:hypothetical protein
VCAARTSHAQQNQRYVKRLPLFIFNILNKEIHQAVRIVLDGRDFGEQ